MAEEGGHESYFWNTLPWIISDNSDHAGCSSAGGDDKKTAVKKVSDSSMPNKQSQVQQAEKGSIAAASGGGEPVVADGSSGGGKRKGGEVDKNGGGGGDKGKGDQQSDDHVVHIWTERERRKKMRNMFSQLHALLRHLPSKTDKSSIVDEAVAYIRTLQLTLQKLQRQKLEKLYGISTTNTTTVASLFQLPQNLAIETSRESYLADLRVQGPSPSSNTNLSGSTSFSFSRCFQTWTSPNVTLNVCGLDAHISICSSKKPGLFAAICFVLDKHKLEIVAAQVSSDHSRRMYMIHAHANAPDQLAEAFPSEEVYKQAAAEMMLWVNS